MEIHRDAVDAAVEADRIECGGRPVGRVDARSFQLAGNLGDRAETGKFRNAVTVHDVHVRRRATGIGRFDLIVVVAPVGRQRVDADPVKLGVGRIDDRLDDAGLTEHLSWCPCLHLRMRRRTGPSVISCAAAVVAMPAAIAAVRSTCFMVSSLNVRLAL